MGPRDAGLAAPFPRSRSRSCPLVGESRFGHSACRQFADMPVIRCGPLGSPYHNPPNQPQGQLGQGDRENKLMPVPVPQRSALGGEAVTCAAAGRGHTAVATAVGAVWCWGGNAAGQVGSGDRDRRLRPYRSARSS